MSTNSTRWTTSNLEEHDGLLPVSGGAPGRGVQAVKDALVVLGVAAAAAAAAAAELDGEVDTDAVDVAGAFRLRIEKQSENWTIKLLKAFDDWPQTDQEIGNATPSIIRIRIKFPFFRRKNRGRPTWGSNPRP